MDSRNNGNGLLERTLRRFRRAWRGTSYGPPHTRFSPELSASDIKQLRHQIDACLEARGGEVSARARAAHLGEAYLELNLEGRQRFLEVLAQDYGVDQSKLEANIENYQSAADIKTQQEAESALRASLIAPRIRLLGLFNALDDGIKFLVDLRGELRRFARSNPELAMLDEELSARLASWFDVGFLTLRQITWDSPATLLEKLIEYEAVHAIDSWDDLKKRLDSDRRLYAFFHPNMPEEPLIFVEVALVHGLADNIQNLLDSETPALEAEATDTAIFYSISNCQPGLAGISFGNTLIKRVARDLARDLPQLKNFATLSPLPGFRKWLDGQANKNLDPLIGTSDGRRIRELARAEDTVSALQSLLALPDWPSDEQTAKALEAMIMPLAAHYLLNERGRAGTRDRVAHFHLSNGARIERINWLADISERGLKNGVGLMINYRYVLQHVEENHEAYCSDGKVTATSAVRKLLKA